MKPGCLRKTCEVSNPLWVRVAARRMAYTVFLEEIRALGCAMSGVGG